MVNMDDAETSGEEPQEPQSPEPVETGYSVDADPVNEYANEGNEYANEGNEYANEGNEYANEDDEVDINKLPGLWPIDSSQSQPTANIYIQQPAGFKTAGRAQVEKAMEEKEQSKKAQDEGSPPVSGLDTSLLLNQLFKTLGLMIQGLLAGFCLFHAIAVWLNTPPRFDYLEFITRYASDALGYHVAYYLAFVLAVVAMLDRYDLAQNPGSVIWRAVTLQSAGLSVLCWLAALGITLSCLATDQRFDLFQTNATLLPVAAPEPQNADALRQLNNWRILLLARACFAVVGWALTALSPATDLLRKHLLEAQEEFNRLTGVDKKSEIIDIENE